MTTVSDIANAREFFGGMTADGVAIITQLLFLKPGETVVYHVGRLPEDRSDAPQSYRTCGVSAKEVDKIASLAESVAKAGAARLLVQSIIDDCSVFCAMGIAAQQ